MLKFYKTKQQTFECKIQLEGSDLSKVKPRLLMYPTNDNRNLFFEGVVKGDMCSIIINPNLELPKTGKAILEIIVDNTTLFQPYETTYEIVSDVITVECVTLTVSTDVNKPKISIVEEVKVDNNLNNVVVNNTPIVEKKVKKTIVVEGVIYKENIDISDKKKINTFLKSIKDLDKIERSNMFKYIVESYKPSKINVAWAKNIFDYNKDNVLHNSILLCKDLSIK